MDESLISKFILNLDNFYVYDIVKYSTVAGKYIIDGNIVCMFNSGTITNYKM